MNLRPTLFIAFCIILSFSSIAQNQFPNDSGGHDTSQVFREVELEASFPGGEMAWRKFLEQNLRADVATEHGAPAGVFTVWMQFIVDREGNLSDIKPLTNWGYGMEAEVVRILKKSPKWAPASQNGKFVKAYRKQPVTFWIEEDGLEVHPEKATVLYIGAENPLTIDARKVKDSNLRVTISQGTISENNGKYIAYVTTVGRAIIDVYNKNKKIGSVSLEVVDSPSTSTKTR